MRLAERIKRLEGLRADGWTPPPVPHGYRLIGRGLLVPEVMTEAEWLEQAA